MNRITFSEKDIKERVSLCQKNLEEGDLRGLVLSAETNINYYTDFHTHAPWTTMTRPLFLFIPCHGKPVLYVHIFHYPDAQAASKGCEVRSFDSLLGPTAVEMLAIMEALNMAKGKVGFEKGHEQRLGYEVNLYEALQKQLPQIDIIDASPLIWKQRMIKSTKEIACIKKACNATSFAHDNVFSAMKTGMTEHDIARLAQTYMLEGGADYPGFVITASGAGNYERTSKTATNRVISDGDFVYLDLGAKYNGYWSDFCRIGVAGVISEQRKMLQQKVHEVTMRAAEILRPGVLASDAARACSKEMKRVGLKANFECGRMGHSMGLMSTEPPSVTIYEDTVLQEGMIINLEPGLINDMGAFILEENFVITKNGYEILSGGSRQLHAIQ